MDNDERIKIIQDVVCETYGVLHMEILSCRRPQEVIIPRHIGMWICKSLTTASYPEIGRKFNKDHSTVISGVKNAAKLMREDIDVFNKAMAVLDIAKNKITDELRNDRH